MFSYWSTNADQKLILGQACVSYKIVYKYSYDYDSIWFNLIA